MERFSDISKPSDNEKNFENSYRFCSHALHSKVSAILGYIEIIENDNLFINESDTFFYLKKIEELSKELLHDFHNLLDSFVSNNI